MGAFDGAMAMESERAFSLQTATVKVSTLLVLAAVAMALWIGRCCFSKIGGVDIEVGGVLNEEKTSCFLGNEGSDFVGSGCFWWSTNVVSVLLCTPRVLICFLFDFPLSLSYLFCMKMEESTPLYHHVF